MSSAAIPAPPPDASGTVRGLVSTGAQTFAGVKTFASDPLFSSGSQLVTSGTQSISGAKTFGSTVASGVAGGADAFTAASGTNWRLGSGSLEYLQAVGDGSGIKVAGYLWILSNNGVYLDAGGSKRIFYDGSSIASSSDLKANGNVLATGNVTAQGGNGVSSTNGIFQASGSNQSAKLYGNVTDGGTAVGVQVAQGNALNTAGAVAMRVFKDNLTTKVLDVLANGDLQPTGKILAAGGLGVGNSAAATTPGSVVKKMQVFDASGTSLGFVPIYSSIT